MAGIMSVMSLLMFVALVQCRLAPACYSTTTPCQLTYTASMPPQIGPTSTVWESIVTTSKMAVDCNVCDVTNVAANPVPAGPFTTKVTSPVLQVTLLGCMPETSMVTRGALTIATPQTTPRPFHQLDDLRRAPLVARQSRNIPQIPGQGGLLISQLTTGIFVIYLIQSGIDLNGACLALGQPVNIMNAALIGINATQAAESVCLASTAGFTFNQTSETLLLDLAAAVYATEIAGNFTGTAETSTLCNNLDFGSLSAFGVDSGAVQTYVCAANNATANNATTTSATAISTPFSPSAGTGTPFAIGNSTQWSTLLGTAPVSGTGTGDFPSGTAVGSSGSFPFSNITDLPSTTGEAPSGTAAASSGWNPFGNTTDLPAGTDVAPSGTADASSGWLPLSNFTILPSHSLPATGLGPVVTDSLSLFFPATSYTPPPSSRTPYRRSGSIGQSTLTTSVLHYYDADW